MYDRLANDLKRVQYDTDDMLTDYFEKPPSAGRKHTQRYSGIAWHRSGRSICKEDAEDLVYTNGRRLNFPVNISFVVEGDPKTGKEL